MSNLDRSQTRRLRGVVLQFVYDGHRNQRPHMDHIMLWALLQDLSFSVGQNDVLTLLQDLSDRRYLCFNEKRNDITGHIEISRIGITPQGRDLLERTVSDPAVLVP